MKNFLNHIKKGFFPFIITFSALSVSASAAFYSVSGLSKLFAGASFEVIIMAGSLEVAKLIVASLLYQYWDTINKLLRTYLTIATVILVIITSMGIYGFLSAAYQDTYRQLTIKDNQIGFLDQKREFYEKDVLRYDQELERISNNISTLSGAKATSIQVRDTAAVGGVRSTVSTAELRLAQSRIEVEEKNRQNVQSKREQVADSLQKYQLEILELENNSEVAGELGPLQYLSELTGVPMNKIINYLLLVIIFVFDPLAISLVVAANFAFNQAYPPKREEDVLSIFDNDEEDKDFSLEDWDEDEAEKRMDIIGRNGNDGEHYEELSNKYEDTSEKVRTLEDKVSSIDKYLDKNAPYYGEKAAATKSVEDFYGEEKPSPEEPKKQITKIYDWNKTERSAPIDKGYDISSDPDWPPKSDDSDEAKTY
tara:strand:+ start:1634 stop:2905 length:1272 start_codon:yes stop_codon:yes gene_type:complete